MYMFSCGSGDMFSGGDGSGTGTVSGGVKYTPEVSCLRDSKWYTVMVYNTKS